MTVASFTQLVVSPAAALVALSPGVNNLLAMHISVEPVAATGWAYLGQRLKAADLGARARRRLDQAVGGVFLGLAGLLASTKR